MPKKQLNVSLAYVPVGNDIRVDGAASCSRRFEGVAWILNYRSENPALKIEKGLGVLAVQAILERLAEGF